MDNDQLLNDELVWLYTHCSALGMSKRSSSGKLEHDIALFTADLKYELNLAKQCLKRALSDFYEEDEYWTEQANELLGNSPKKSRSQLLETIGELKLELELSKQKTNSAQEADIPKRATYLDQAETDIKYHSVESSINNIIAHLKQNNKY